MRLVSQAGTGHFYTTSRNKQKPPLEFLKHDPVGKLCINSPPSHSNAHSFTPGVMGLTLIADPSAN